MKDFYLNSIEAKKRGNKEIFDKLVIDIFGKSITWKEITEQDTDKLITLMCEMDRQIKIKKSNYDIKKLARAIQNSRSGAGGCAMTDFKCSFCGKEEVWVNTAVPNICSDCSEKMATNFVLYNMDILKDN